MKLLIVANWKCNPISQKAARKLLNSLKKGLRNIKKTEIVICPPFVYLKEAFEVFGKRKQNQIKLGAQNCFWEEKGAFTGEISPKMLKDLRCSYVILGHSERREIIGEKDKEIGEKLKIALNTGLKPILCVGETKEQRKKGRAFKVVERELLGSLKRIPKNQIEKVIIAYEPIWAIGSGNPCSPNEALTAALYIRKVISQNFNQKAARKLQILYGGSVNSENAKGYLQEQHINGLLVGGASLDSAEFIKIVKIASELK